MNFLVLEITCFRGNCVLENLSLGGEFSRDLLSQNGAVVVEEGEIGSD